MYTVIRQAAVAVALVAMAGCGVHNTEVPAVSGPSTFGSNFTVNAVPDAISQDGGSQSSIKVLVIGPDGKGVSGVPMRMDMAVNGVAQDIGSLSARTIVTSTDGIATVVYTAPPAPPSGLFGTCANLPGSCVSIVATPTGTNFQTSVSQSVVIRLVPPGVILPPAGTPTAAFTMSPSPAQMNVPLTFDASSSFAGAGALSITSYAWTFGDGTAQGAGRSLTHTFAQQQSFNVSLTIINDRGLSATTTVAVAVGSVTSPTAVFVFSPTSPQVNQTIVFNADQSTAASGHVLTAFNWNFGDGGTASGVTVSHLFTAAGTFNVVLSIGDDTGQKSTSTSGVTVTSGGGGGGSTTAKFTFSPSAPTANQAVFFNGSTSTPSTGHAITTYIWDFGDGISGSGVSLAHTYLATGTFTVTLIVTDDGGQKATTSLPVPVTASGGAGGAPTPPTATFTFGPPNPSVNEVVSFNATSSTAGAGRSIASYVWNFGDGSPAGAGITTTHAFTTAATFPVTLRVTDDGVPPLSTTSASTGVTVGAPQSPTANFTFSPASPGRNDQVVFDASSSTQAGAGQPIVDVAWNFGDGTAVIHCNAVGGAVPPATIADCPNASNIRISAHTFTTNQNFVVNLVVTDSVGRIGSRNVSVNVALAQPNVLITASPGSPTTVQTVSFGSGGTTFFPGSGPGPLPGSYVWNFGDGSLPATGQSASHIYGAPGTYTATLSVTDNTACGAPRCPAGTPGRTGVGSTTVTVTLPTPPAAPVARFTFSPPAPKVSDATNTVTFDAFTSTSVAGGGITDYRWNFGDGSGPINGPGGSAAPFPGGTFVAPKHTYAAGTFTVTLTVTDANGTGSTTGTVLVVP